MNVVQKSIDVKVLVIGDRIIIADLMEFFGLEIPKQGGMLIQQNSHILKVGKHFFSLTKEEFESL